MKTRVIAIAPYDGWAFIVEDEKIYLLRPPYVLSKSDEVSQYEVENAISAHGFEECDITFDSIDEVIQFLKDQFVTLRKNQGIEIPSSEELRKLLEYAPEDVLLEYLRRAEEELIPKGKFDVAESIVSDLMKLKQVQSNPEMKNMAARIIEECQDIKTASGEATEKEFPEEELLDFPFNLIISELQEIESGKDVEFLKEIRSVRPAAFGSTATAISFAFQVFARYTYYDIDTDEDIDDIAADDIPRIIADIVEDKDHEEEFSEVPRILMRNIEEARIKAKRSLIKVT